MNPKKENKRAIDLSRQQPNTSEVAQIGRLVLELNALSKDNPDFVEEALAVVIEFFQKQIAFAKGGVSGRIRSLNLPPASVKGKEVSIVGLKAISTPDLRDNLSATLQGVASGQPCIIKRRDNRHIKLTPVDETIAWESIEIIQLLQDLPTEKARKIRKILRTILQLESGK